MIIELVIISICDEFKQRKLASNESEHITLKSDLVFIQPTLGVNCNHYIWRNHFDLIYLLISLASYFSEDDSGGIWTSPKVYFFRQNNLYKKRMLHCSTLELI